MSSKSNQDNRSNQLNPNNDAYHSSRGTSRPDGDDDDADSVKTCWHITSIERINEAHGRQPRVETFAFGAVSLDGRAIFRMATFTIPNFSFGANDGQVRLEDYLTDFERLACAKLAKSFGSNALALFAVFDPTESCLPWHVPLQLENLQNTRAAISFIRLAYVADRLRPLPAPPNFSMLSALSAGAGVKAEVQYRALAADKLDPSPFIETLRQAVAESAPSWGGFTVPREGRMGIREQRQALKQLSDTSTP